MQELEYGVTVEDVADLPVTGRLFRAPLSKGPRPLILYVYGGTFGFNHGPSHERIAATLAREAKGDVLLPCYSLSPERAFPLAVEDIALTYQALLEEGRPPSQIVLVADTAGASIGFGALLSLRARGVPMPVGAVALFPWVDLTMSGGSYIDHIREDERISDVEIVATLLTDYLQGADPRDPLASPALADLAGLPSLQVHANVSDIFADDARLLAERAREAGVLVKLHLWDQMPDTLQRNETFSPKFQALLAMIGKFVRAQVRQADTRRRSQDRLQDDYLQMMAAHIQPHMAQRAEEMFAWAKDHGPDWVWNFIEKRLDHGALATQDQIEHDWLATLFTESPIPTILLTASRYVVHANRAAYEELEQGTFVKRQHGRLVGQNAEADALIAEMFILPLASQSAKDGVSLARLTSDDGASLFLRCHRLSPKGVDHLAPPVAVLRLLRDVPAALDIDARSLMVWYGLSPREAGLAVDFANGVSLAEYAAREGVSMPTVRTQFAQIKTKLDARDQADVVRKLLAAAALNH